MPCYLIKALILGLSLDDIKGVSPEISSALFQLLPIFRLAERDVKEMPRRGISYGFLC